MKALVVSGLKQEYEPHPGLRKFAERFLSNYAKVYLSHADIGCLCFKEVDIVICHSLGAAAVWRKLKCFGEERSIRVVFWDTVTQDWNKENLGVSEKVVGLSVIKNPGWKFWKAYPPSCDIKGPHMSTRRYDMFHNQIVNDDGVQQDVAIAMGLAAAV